MLNQHISELVRRHAFCAVWPVVDGSASPINFNSLPMLHRHLLVGIQLARDGLMLDAEYRKLCLIIVGSFLSTPDRWPSLFGNPMDLYTVRHFWGRYWHQMFRNVGSAK